MCRWHWGVVILIAAPRNMVTTGIFQVSRVKRDAYDCDPQLFQALAGPRLDQIQTHVDTLSGVIRSILAADLKGTELNAAVSLIGDATIAFRTPMMIARFRARATDMRASAVLDAVLASLDIRTRLTGTP